MRARRGRSPGSRQRRSPSRSSGLASVDQWHSERAGPASLPGLLQWRGRAGFAPASRDPIRGMSVDRKICAPRRPRKRIAGRPGLLLRALPLPLGRPGRRGGRTAGGRPVAPRAPSSLRTLATTTATGWRALATTTTAGRGPLAPFFAAPDSRPFRPRGAEWRTALRLVERRSQALEMLRVTQDLASLLLQRVRHLHQFLGRSAARLRRSALDGGPATLRGTRSVLIVHWLSGAARVWIG